MKVGDTLYERRVYRYKREPEIIAHVVAKTGRKYFYTDDGEDTPFRLDNLRHESKHSSQYDKQLYKSEQEILDMLERSELIQELRQFFQYNVTLTLDQPRSIHKIVKEEK